MISKTTPISMRIIKNQVVQRSITTCVYGKSMETKTTTWSEFINWKDTVEQILGSVKINKSRCKTVRLKDTYQCRKNSHLCKIVWDREITTGFKRFTSSTRIGYPALIMGIQISKDKYITEITTGCRKWSLIKQNAQLVKLIKHQKHLDVSDAFNKLLGLAFKGLTKCKNSRFRASRIENFLCHPTMAGSISIGIHWLKNIQIYIFPLLRPLY